MFQHCGPKDLIDSKKFPILHMCKTQLPGVSSLTSLFCIFQGSIKKKIESFRRWSSASIKRPPKPKAKTLSLSSPVGDPEDMWLQEGDRRKLRPIVKSVFGQVGHCRCLFLNSISKVCLGLTHLVFVKKRRELGR